MRKAVILRQALTRRTNSINSSTYSLSPPAFTQRTEAKAQDVPSDEAGSNGDDGKPDEAEGSETEDEESVFSDASSTIYPTGIKIYIPPLIRFLRMVRFLVLH